MYDDIRERKGKIFMFNFTAKHWANLRGWWSGPLGQAFLLEEQKEIQKVASKLFGYHLLLLGEPQLMQCMAESPISHRIWLHPSAEKRQDSSPLTARFDKLPLQSDSVDVIYLAHCLEFINNPHEVLRETYRSLIPEGYVFISSFNPWSIWGLTRWILHYIRRLEWDGRFISVTKLKDWLALLGFDVIRVRKYFFRPPISRVTALQRLNWLETVGQWFWPFLGGGYVVVAKKRIIVLTPIKPAWQRQREMMHDAAGVVEPTARLREMSESYHDGN